VWKLQKFLCAEILREINVTEFSIFFLESTEFANDLPSGKSSTNKQYYLALPLLLD